MRDNAILQCVKTVESLVGKPAHAPEPTPKPKVRPFAEVVGGMLHGTGVQLSQRTLEQLEHQQQHRQAA